MLNDKLNSNERPVLINALPEESYVACRIPGSISVSVDSADLVERIVPDKDQDIVVYCANADCDTSPTLVNTLIDKGYTRVWDFENGFEGWSEAGYQLMGHETG